ncbi:MAG: hypothetical protein AAGC73_00415 [Verrucomicrobiota bacterium]
MQLSTAITKIQTSLAKMNTAYKRVVFDETAVMSWEGASLKLHYYEGPRREVFTAEFADDTISLREELMQAQTSLGGEFSFTREGSGAKMDAYICLGPKVYLFCNNMAKSMHEVTSDPQWLEAQSDFLNLSQQFAVDPLSL